ncbi:hypothetical protein X760_30055 [Mesorhizobium sp. LSHC422A00]|nr:hypothetical protein X760_30055 [Mesorhizobium sp. LSHC422A00]
MVLVVEDEPLILLDLETGLGDAGFRVVAVHTAEAAIEAFSEEPARPFPCVPHLRPKGRPE